MVFDSKAIEEKLGVTFRDKQLLKTALTHSSYANEHRQESDSYERFEFLGDAIVEFVVSEYLFLHKKNMTEGQLTKLRASLVCEKTFSNLVKKMNLQEHIRLSHGEAKSNGASRDSLLCDVFEAIVASIFLDGGLEKAKEFVIKQIKPVLDNEKAFKDYKSKFQEIVQQNPGEKISYVLVKEEGPPHDKTFEVELHLNSMCVGKGIGKSKKSSEQEAAKNALKLMGYQY